MPDQETYMDRLKKNPIKSALSVLALISALSTAALGFEMRYNQTADVFLIEISYASSVVSDLEDKILLLNMRIGTKDEQATDKAMLDRYKSRLQDAQQVLHEKQESQRKSYFYA